MNFTVSTISKSLSDYLAPFFPGVTFYAVSYTHLTLPTKLEV